MNMFKTILLSLCAMIFVSSQAFAADKDIVETAMSNDDFSTLVELVKEAGLVDTLKGSGPFTLFAPTNEAFAKIPAADLAALKSDKTKLAEVLKYHLISGSVIADKVAGMKTAKTVEGERLTIDTSKGVKIDNAMVTQTDIMAKNGVIHVVDTVLMP